MGGLLKKIVASRAAQRSEEREAELYRALIRREAKIGGELFGPVSAGTRREFFCLDERTWIWHEEWISQDGKREVRTTRYDVRPNGILKAQGNSGYQRVSQSEAERFRKAAHAYSQRIRSELYAAYL